MNETLNSVETGETTIIYDGQCPFCTAYTRLVRMREAAGPVTLVDARTRPDVVAELNSRGLDLDEGMVVQHGSRLYYGSDALNIMAMMSTRSGLWNRVLAALFSSERTARLAYPFLRAGRNLTLRMLGRKRINRG